MEGGGAKEDETGARVSKMGAKERRKVESLGWLTESSVMPKKQRAIAGVGASSIVELRAELYRTQEDVRRAKEGAVDADVLRSRRKIGVSDKFAQKNAGVEERAAIDALHLKSSDDGAATYAALEKKAELYDKLVKGGIPDEEVDKYNVDFFRKGYLEEEAEEMKKDAADDDLEDRNRDPSGLKSEDRQPQSGWRRDGATGLTQEHKQIVREVNEETKNAREKTSVLKQQRQQQAFRKREQLRQQYLKRQVERLKTQRQQHQISSPSGDQDSPGTAS